MNRMLSPAQFAELTPFSAESIRRRLREQGVSAFPGARRYGRLWLIPEHTASVLGRPASPPTPVSQAVRTAEEQEAFMRERDLELRRR